MARRKSSIADDLVLLPWWVSVILAVAAYGILPGVLPPPMVKAGVVGMITIALFAIAVISALRAWSNRRMLEAQTGLDSLCELPSKRFEDLLAEAYRRQGYKVEETLGGGADGGVDLVLRRDGKIILVQCKRWKGKPVPVQTVRELYGVLHDRGASAAKLVATTRFTPEAITFARGKPIELLDSDALLELLRGVQTSGRIAPTPSSAERAVIAPSCPRCGLKMVMRPARRGPNAGSNFWGCSDYPRCRGTRAI
jgi:restriction system protein